MKRRVFRRVDTHAAHLSLVGSLVFFVVTQPLRSHRKRFPKIGEKNPELRSYVEHVKELFVRGLKR